MEERMEEAKKLVEEMNKDENLSEAEEMIKDNKITFSYNDKKYRVHLLDSFEKEELNNLRRKKFNSMLQEKDEKGNYVYLFAEDLMKVLKERGKDVEKNREEINSLQAEERDLRKKLGEALDNNEGDTVLENYRDKIKENIIRQSILDTQNTLWLESSFENVLEEYVYKIITYLSSKILEEGIWKKLFSSIEDFENCKDEKLLIELGKRAVPIQYLK